MTTKELEVKLQHLPPKFQVRFALFCAKKRHYHKHSPGHGALNLIALWLQDETQVTLTQFQTAILTTKSTISGVLPARSALYTAYAVAIDKYAADAASHTAIYSSAYAVAIDKYAADAASHTAIYSSDALVGSTLSSLYNDFMATLTSLEKALYDTVD